MIYDDAIEEVQTEEETIEIEEAPSVRLAQVTSLSSGKAAVKFYGESEASTKYYPYIEGYKPTVNDNVAMLAQGNTFIILGKISNENITTNYNVLKSELETILASYLTTETAASTYLSQTDAAANYRGKNEYFDRLGSGSNNISISGNQANVSGTLDFGTDTYRFRSVTTTNIDTDAIRTPNGTSVFNITSGHMDPATNTGASIGTSSKQLLNLYAKNIYLNGSPISSSDRRKKKSIKDLARKYKELLFRLCPVSYKYKDGTSGRTHTGFIAQEVEQAAADVGIELKDLAAVVIEENGDYGIRYEEFVSILTAVVQDHERELRDLHDLVTDQQAKIEKLGRELINIKKSMK